MQPTVATNRPFIIVSLDAVCREWTGETAQLVLQAWLHQAKESIDKKDHFREHV